MKPIRVLLADDHALLRAGINSLLKGREGINVVAEARDGHEALRLIPEWQPDIVLMDIAMSGMNGLEATARATQEFPAVRIIMLTMYAHQEYLLQALRVGAAGYLLKDTDLDELATAIHIVANGATYLSPSMAAYVLNDSPRVAPESETESSPFEQLTPRQREVLQYIAEGYTTKKIAHKLNISPKTVEAHRTQLMERLKIYDVPGLVRYALRVGIVAAEAPQTKDILPDLG